ncbi:hypothetical protein ACHAXS_013315 [Conticribra weissflogii]
MSASILSRQLSTLKIGQHTISPWIVSRSIAAAAASVPSMMCRESTQERTRAINLIQPINVHHLMISTTLTRNVFTIASSQSGEDTALLNDDGGPVLGSSDVINLKDMTNEELADMSTIPGWNLVHNPPRHNPRGALVGKVVSDKMRKTVNVAVDRYRIVPKYRKRRRFTKKFMAHDEHEVCNVGDLVMIVPCQKISRHKHFMVREIIRPKGQL